MRYGSLCSGIGGLDRAVEHVWPDASPAWFCEADSHAASVLRRWWPNAPILPDLKTQDWTQVEPVELVTAGYPCQPFSAAGRRRGVDDPRHLWPFVIAAVRVLRPRLVILENVAGHLGLGFDSVLADLAEAGFDAEWTVVPASDVGACHRRERLFVLAYAAGGQRDAQPRRDALERWTREAEQVGLGDSSAADAGRERLGQHAGEPSAQEAGSQEDHQPDGDGSRWSAPDADLEGLEGPEPAERHVLSSWGDYESAIRRWEHKLGRRAPEPTDEKGRLNVPFVEWMMGFDAGWVDDLSRTAALRCLGNSVVQQQGAMALSMLLEAS